MKFQLLALAITFSTTGAFSPIQNRLHSFSSPYTVLHETKESIPVLAQESTGNSDNEQSVLASETNIFDRLGFKEDEVAIGIDPKKVLQYLGNRDAIVEKFTSDNKGMEKDQIDIEVNKFMMDVEMVNSFIQYEVKKSDPKFRKDEAEQSLTDPGNLSSYASFLIGGAGFAYVKNVIIEPKFASGEWTEFHINLPTLGIFAPAATDISSTL